MSRSSLRLIIFPLLTLLLAAVIIINNYGFISRPDSTTTTYLNSFTNGNIGYGDAATYDNKISLAGLEPGDILLGGWPNCAYGVFSHTGLYLGDNKVLEGYIDSGITINRVEHFNNYEQACILRVKVGEDVKKRAVAYALRQQGKMFYPVAFKNGERYWNCSKIIWKAYLEQGINLDSSGDLWMAPDIFYSSPHVQVIAQTKHQLDKER